MQQSPPPNTQEFSGVLTDCACFHIRRAARIITNFFDRHLAHHNVKTTQFLVLAGIHKQGKISIGHLADMLHQDQTGLSRNIKILNSRGFILCEPGRDRRQNMLSLSAQGENCLKAAIPDWRRAQMVIQNTYGERWSEFIEDLNRAVKVLEL